MDTHIPQRVCFVVCLSSLHPTVQSFTHIRGLPAYTAFLCSCFCICSPHCVYGITQLGIAG